MVRVLGFFAFLLFLFLIFTWLPGWWMGFFLLPLPLLLCRFLFLEEGYAVAVMRLKGFSRFVMRWTDYSFDDDWNVVPAPGKRYPWGGLVVMWFFEKPHTYHLTWKTLKQDGTITAHIREQLSRVLLMDKVYYSEISGAEDANLMPLKIRALITVRVENPYKALFGVDDWLQVMIDRVAPAIRDAATEKTYQVLLTEKKDVGGYVFENQKHNIDSLLGQYGFKITNIAILDIGPERAEDREATERPFREKYEAEAAVVKAEGEAKVSVIKARAEAEAEFYERLGAWLYAQAASLGLTIEELPQKMAANDELRAGFIDYAQKIHHDVEMAERGARLEVDTGDVASIDAAIAKIIALWKGIPPRGGGSGKKKGGGSGSSPGPGAEQKKKPSIKEMFEGSPPRGLER